MHSTLKPIDRKNETSVLHLPSRDDAVNDLEQAETGRDQAVRAGSHGNCHPRANQRPPVPGRQVPRRPGGLEGSSCPGKAPSGGSEFDVVRATVGWSKSMATVGDRERE